MCEHLAAIASALDLSGGVSARLAAKHADLTVFRRFLNTSV